MIKKIIQKHYFLIQENEIKAKGQRVHLSFNDILTLITNSNYSAGFFKRNFRSNKLFNSTDIIIFDIDEPQINNKSLLDVSLQLKVYKHILATTKSHQISKNGITCDRYRILFFLDKDVETPSSYKKTAEKIEQLLGLKTDPKTKSPARLYFKSTQIISSNQNGQTIQPIFDNEEISSQKTKIREFEYKISECQIPPEIIQWINKDNKKDVAIKKEKFIRILMAQHNLLTRNFLPQAYLAKSIGIERVTLRKYFKELISMNLLMIVDEWYCTGRARQHRALNALKEAIQQSLYKYNVDNVLPTEVKDGQWHDEIIKAAWKFSNDDSPDRFLKWTETLPNYFDKPDRKLKPLEAWNSVKKRIKILKNYS